MKTIDYGTEKEPRFPYPHISNSQRIAFSMCNAAYGFRYFEKLPSLANSDMLRGTLIHATTEQAILNILRGASKEVAIEHGNAFIDAYSEEETFLAKPRWTKGTTATWETIKTDAKAAFPLVISFLFDNYYLLSVEHRMLMSFEEEFGEGFPPLVGIADYVVRSKDNGKLAIFDTKSGSKKKNDADLANDDAQVLYAAGISDILQEQIETIEYLNLVFSSPGPKVVLQPHQAPPVKLHIVSRPYQPERVRRAMTHLYALQKAKEAEFFVPLQTGWQCKECSYNKTCQERYGPIDAVTQDEES